jgi:CheY-like chemotaxis protein
LQKKPSILYVDDDPDDRELFGYALSTCGAEYDLITAEDAFDALKILQSGERPSCLYVDINMPGMNGIQLLSVLKADSKYASIPVFMFSTAVDKKTASEAKKLGAVDVIIKPSSFQGLIDHLQVSFRAGSE